MAEARPASCMREIPRGFERVLERVGSAWTNVGGAITSPLLWRVGQGLGRSRFFMRDPEQKENIERVSTRIIKLEELRLFRFVSPREWRRRFSRDDEEQLAHR